MAQHISWHICITGSIPSEELIEIVEGRSFQELIDIISEEGFPFIVKLDPKIQNRWVAARWAKKTLNNRFTHLPYALKNANDRTIYFLFETADDALRFKLVWG